MKKSILNSLLLLSCGLAYSGQSTKLNFDLKSKTPLVNNAKIRPFAVISAGVDFIHTGQSQSLMLSPPFNNYYASDSSYPSSASLGLGVGVEGHPSELFFWQLGVFGFFNTEVTSSGEVWQFGLPEFNNFNYRYNVQVSRVVAAGKLLSTFKQVVHPYVSGELGAAFNAASAYHETPLIEEAVAAAPFANHTQSSFSWGIGAGIDVDVNNNLRLGVGYQFTDLGKASLGLSPAQITNERLVISNLYDQQLRFQLTALA